MRVPSDSSPAERSSRVFSGLPGATGSRNSKSQSWLEEEGYAQGHGGCSATSLSAPRSLLSSKPQVRRLQGIHTVAIHRSDLSLTQERGGFCSIGALWLKASPYREEQRWKVMPRPRLIRPSILYSCKDGFKRRHTNAIPLRAWLPFLSQPRP